MGKLTLRNLFVLLSKIIHRQRPGSMAAQYLKNKFEVITVSGEDSELQKKSKFSQINSGNFQILISTGRFLGEGADIPSLDFCSCQSIFTKCIKLLWQTRISILHLPDKIFFQHHFAKIIKDIRQHNSKRSWFK